GIRFDDAYGCAVLLLRRHRRGFARGAAHDQRVRTRLVLERDQLREHAFVDSVVVERRDERDTASVESRSSHQRLLRSWRSPRATSDGESVVSTSRSVESRKSSAASSLRDFAWNERNT